MKKANKQLPYLVTLLFVILLSYFTSKHLVQLLLIQGESMEPTYHSMQLVLLDKTAVEYKSGDCVLFYCEGLDCNLVKRIVALPGETVQIKDGTLYIDSIPYSPYPGCPKIEDAGLAGEILPVPEGCCFVLGDNFSESRDSRHEEVGLVNINLIKGKIK